MTMFLATLPKQYQDVAKNIIQQQMRKSSSGKHLLPYSHLVFLYEILNYS